MWGACNVIGIWGCGEDMSDRHFPLRAHIYVDHSIPSIPSVGSLLTPGPGFLKSRKHFLPPSARRPNKTHNTGPRCKEYRRSTGSCLCLCSNLWQWRADTGSQKDHNILPPGVGVPLPGLLTGAWRSPGLHFITTNTRLWPWLPPVSVTINTHPPMSASVVLCMWTCLSYYSPFTNLGIRLNICIAGNPDLSSLICGSHWPDNWNFNSQSDRDHQLNPRHRKVAQMNHFCHIIKVQSTIKYVTYSFIWAIFYLSRKMLSCRKRKQPKGICNTSLQNITIVVSTTLLLLLFGLFLYCFYFVYTNGFLPNKPFFKFTKTPVQTMTKSLQLEKSILGKFFLTKYFCHLCVQLVQGAFL